MKNLTKNNIIVYGIDNQYIVHRIIDIDGDMITTKGDANNTSDEPINKKNISLPNLFFFILHNLFSYTNYNKKN